MRLSATGFEQILTSIKHALPGVNGNLITYEAMPAEIGLQYHVMFKPQAKILSGACAGAGAGQAAASLVAPVDVIVTEIFDSELLGEGMLPTMRHAAAHLLQVC